LIVSVIHLTSGCVAGKGGESLGDGGTYMVEYGRKVNRTSIWERNGKNVIYGFRNMYQLEVVDDPDDVAYPFKGWFFGWMVEDGNPGFPGCDAICAARAKALGGPWEIFAGEGKWDSQMKPETWKPVVTARDKFFDEWHNGDPSVVKLGGKYYMAYSSTGKNKDGKHYGEPGDRDGSLCCIMGAVSEDEINWHKSEFPILIHKEDVGAGTVPQGDAHMNGIYHRPALLHEDGKFKLWFDYWTDKGLSMGYAENSGEFLNHEDWRVIRADDDPCLFEFPNPDIIKVGDVYFAYADPGVAGDHPWKRRMLTEAVSVNGLDWVVLGYVEPDGDAPATHVPQAFVTHENGETWINVSYACQIGGNPNYDYRYRCIRFMRRKIGGAELAYCRSICSQEGYVK